MTDLRSIEVQRVGGMVLKLNVKTVSLVDENGEQWNVAPNLLTVLEEKR